MIRKKTQRGRPVQWPKIEVIWEPVPNPDPEAWLRAVAMLFSRRYYGPEERGEDTGYQPLEDEDN